MRIDTGGMGDVRTIAAMCRTRPATKTASLMAFLDDRDNAVVLRLVYAGPPMSGKTETVRALSRLLLGVHHTDAVFTPGEANERTLFFDWLEYSGGSFQGHRIRCQIVSVPGQNLLHRRRRALLEQADAIVFVIDAHAEHRETIARSYDELRTIMAEAAEEVPVGIVVQANKSDLPDTLDKQTLLQLCGDNPNTTIIPSVATQGTGVREAFVRAVGLGLARAHAQMTAGTLDAEGSFVTSGEALLQQLLSEDEAEYGVVGASARRDAAVVAATDAERDHLESRNVCAIIERHARRAESARQADRSEQVGPRPPDDRLDAGMVWPPIAGRIVLHEISANPPVVTITDHQLWVAQTAERWLLLSLPAHCQPTQDAAREELLRQARLHARFKALLSEHRCICAAPSGLGDWRIWQIVRRETTLADILRLTLSLKSADSVATELLRVGRMLCRAVELFRDAGLPVTPALESLAISHGTPVYTRHLLLDANAVACIDVDAVALLQQELRHAVATLARRSASAPSLLRQLEAARAVAPASDIVPETLIALFLQQDGLA
jgi:signal recognition particle receptor subunit beta